VFVRSDLAPLAASLLLALGGCAAEPPAAPLAEASRPVAATAVTPIHLEVHGFTEGERVQIAQAVEDWNATGLARFEYGSGGWTIAHSDVSLPQYAVTNTAAHEVMVYKSAPSDLRGIMRHELGHVLGLDHAKTGLMSSKYDQRAYSRIDAQTVQTLARLEARAPMPNAVATER
jgi:hypothetical protein